MSFIFVLHYIAIITVKFFESSSNFNNTFIISPLYSPSEPLHIYPRRRPMYFNKLICNFGG